MVRVALVQLAVNATESVPARIERALALTRASAGESDLVILPELWPTGAFDLRLGIEHAQPLNGPLVGQLSQLAASTGTYIHGGSFVEVDAEGNFFNTAVVFSPTGGLLATYRKIHLFGFEGGEAALLAAGDELVVIDTPLGKTGLATCYDLRFPEMFRALTDNGATAVLVASGWPESRMKRWTVLAQARALENQTWLIGCNETGLHGADVQLGGGSIVTDPWGDILAEADSTPQVLYAEIDPSVPNEVRRNFPVLNDRRIG